MNISYLATVMLLPVLLLCNIAHSGGIPLIDAHSQVAKGLDVSTIIPLMDKAGVCMTLLSARNDRSPSDVLRFAKEHPTRIVPMVRTKGKPFNENRLDYYRFMEKQLANPTFRGMAEILLYHAQKGNKAPEIAVYPDEPQAEFAIEACLERGWPVVIHIEFVAAKANRQNYMKKLEALLRAHPEHAFVLIHMAQLGPDEVERLLATHSNLYFLTSRSNSHSVKQSKQPWVNLFQGKQFAPDWHKLLIAFPDRFILALDNVWANDWGEFYLMQVRLWETALNSLPPDVAHSIAHKNAERLWGLEPLQ